MMLSMDTQNTPLPRFWILPHGLKSAVVMISDDHGTSGATFDIFNDMAIVSAKDCSMLDWQCVRGSSLLYTSSGLTPAQATLSQSLGFSLGVHVQTSCGNYSNYSDLASSYSSQIATFRAKYTDITPQIFDRTHCYVWSDWDSVPKVDKANGIRINYNYEWYPSSWTGSNTGYLTGSGLSMRFTDINGGLIDTYQGVTDLDYETDPSISTINTDFDNTVNSNAFYGVLGTHYDTSGTDYYKLLMEAAQAHNIPMISAAQLATWKDALGSSTFTNISSSSSKLTFSTDVAQGGAGMQTMIPASSGNGLLTSIVRNGATVDYSLSVVKGLKYAIFNAQPGDYVVTYGVQQQDTASQGSSNADSSASTTGRGKAYATIFDNTATVSNTPGTSEPSVATNQQDSVSNSSSATSSNKSSRNPQKTSHTTFFVVISAISGVIIIAGGSWWLIGRHRRHT